MSTAVDPREKIYQPPAPPLVSRLPVVGQKLKYVDSPLATMFRRYRHYGPVSDLHFLGQTWPALLGPDACQIALQNPYKSFANGPGWDTWPARSSTAV